MIDPRHATTAATRPGVRLIPPKVAATHGYVVVGADGRIYTNGDSSISALVPAGLRGAKVVAAARRSAAGGGLRAMTDASLRRTRRRAARSTSARTRARIVGIASATNGGYWLASTDGHIYSVGAPDFGSRSPAEAHCTRRRYRAAPGRAFGSRPATGTSTASGRPRMVSCRNRQALPGGRWFWCLTRRIARDSGVPSLERGKRTDCRRLPPSSHSSPRSSRRPAGRSTPAPSCWRRRSPCVRRPIPHGWRSISRNASAGTPCGATTTPTPSACTRRRDTVRESAAPRTPCSSCTGKATSHPRGSPEQTGSGHRDQLRTEWSGHSSNTE